MNELVETPLKRAYPSVETFFVINWETRARKREMEGGEEEGEKKETGAIWAIAVEVLGGKNKGKRKIGCGGFCGRGESRG